MARNGLKPPCPESLNMAPFVLGFLFLVVMVSGAAVGWLLLRPGKYTIWQRVQYAPVYLFAKYLWRAEIFKQDAKTGQWLASSSLLADIPELIQQANANQKVPRCGTCKHQGAVVVANHRASVDPCFIQLAAGDRVHWMVAGEYFKVPIVGSLLRSVQCIPTNRGGVDTASTKQAIELAKQGRFVGMFPEGRINRTEDAWMAVRPGAALVALRARVPLIPIWIEGARMGSSVMSPFFMPAQVQVYLGQPDYWGIEQLELQDGRSDRQIADEWIRRVLADCVQRVRGQCEPIQLAGAKWLNSKETSTDSSTDSSTLEG